MKCVIPNTRAFTSARRNLASSEMIVGLELSVTCIRARVQARRHATKGTRALACFASGYYLIQQLPHRPARLGDR